LKGSPEHSFGSLAGSERGEVSFGMEKLIEDIREQICFSDVVNNDVVEAVMREAKLEERYAGAVSAGHVQPRVSAVPELPEWLIA